MSFNRQQFEQANPGFWQSCGKVLMSEGMDMFQSLDSFTPGTRNLAVDALETYFVQGAPMPADMVSGLREAPLSVGRLIREDRTLRTLWNLLGRKAESELSPTDLRVVEGALSWLREHTTEAERSESRPAQDGLWSVEDIRRHVGLVPDPEDTIVPFPPADSEQSEMNGWVNGTTDTPDLAAELSRQRNPEAWTAALRHVREQAQERNADGAVLTTPGGPTTEEIKAQFAEREGIRPEDVEVDTVWLVAGDDGQVQEVPESIVRALGLDTRH